MSDPVISCRNLEFSYPGTRAGKPVLKGISLDFYPGEFVALLGRNGAGKSSLLDCLSGLNPAGFDRLTIGDLALPAAGRRDIARRLSYVPQVHEEMFPFSVLDVVVMGRTVFLGSFGAPGKADMDMAEAVLDELQISHLTRRTYTGLSGGEKQMVLLARALVQTRKIVFLDEPTNHLDYSNRYRMLARLKTLSREDGSCVVACLHDPNHALLFADRVILLEQGRILDEGSVRQVLSGTAVSRLYGITAWQKAAPAPESIFPAFVHDSFRERVLILAGSSGEGKTTRLKEAVNKNKGLRFGGILCPGTFKQGRRFSSSVKNLATGESAPFARRTGDSGNSPFTFFEAGQTLADRALSPDTNKDCDCVIVDEVGPLELKGQGHAPLLAPLLSLQKPRHIWAVRPGIVDAVCGQWMLSDPVVVNVSDPDVLSKIDRFLRGSGGSHE